MTDTRLVDVYGSAHDHSPCLGTGTGGKVQTTKL